MPNGAIRIKIPPFDSELEIVLITDVKCITIFPSKLRNDRFYEEHICVPRDHNSLQAACKLRVKNCKFQFDNSDS
jgi:hypothetical protein